MINLRAVYTRAEEHTKLAVGGLFAVLVLLVVLQSVFSPTLVLSGVIVFGVIVLTIARPHIALGLLAVYLPFESIVLKFTPDEVYIFVRYFAESLIYLVALVTISRLLSGKLKHKVTTVDLPFLLFVITLVASVLINLVAPTTALLGIRQILRFMIVFFLVVDLAPSRQFIKQLTIVMFGIVLLQSVIGILQSVIGEPLDVLLLPSDARTLGDITLTSGVQQFWDPGSRVFATLGRYDRLGNFLYFFLLMGVGLLFTKRYVTDRRLLWLFALGLPTLILTYSRASWFAFLLGFLFIGVMIKRDKRVLAGLAIFVILVTGFVGASNLNVSQITEGPGQTLSERFYESFSYARWRGEYYGLGRVFWFIHTPVDVVAASPIFGFGPGQFGGGVAAAMHNTEVYENLGLPFGVFGTEGFIDNNWFSLWGETGTLGMVFYIWMLLGIFFMSLKTAREAKDPFTRAMALGLCAAIIGVSFNAFTSTVLEIRSIAFYLWLYAGFVYVLAREDVAKLV
ncbi:hypothetical protein HOI18_02640 [Candidatus Uhrbacteria bacterium]|jgi:O-antigen ligase|nr:hypothetical protein [Candidatus Uhrbacteria bacterium]